MAQTAHPNPAGAGIKARLSELKKRVNEMDSEAAVRELIALTKEFPEAHQTYAALARLLMRQKKNDYALRAAEKAVALAPLEAKQHALLGLARLRNDDLEGASAAFAQVFELDRDSAPGMLGAAAVLSADGRNEDALELCQRALEVDPSMHRAHRLAARINVKLGKPEAAAQELRKVLEQDISNNRALRAYVRLMRKAGRPEDVLGLAEASLASEPVTSRSLARYTRIVSAAGRPDLAVDQYRTLIESGSAREVDKVRLASALIEVGRLDEAHQAIATLKDRRAMKPLKDMLSGDIELAAGRPERAIDYYQTACKGARVEGLSDKTLQQRPDELAKAWKSHTAKALRNHRREMAARRAK